MAKCAFAMVLKDDHVLLVQIAPPFRHAFDWNFPGGVIEQGESITDGLVREVHEETGLICEPRQLLDTFVFPDTGDEVFIYQAAYISGEFTLQQSELLDARWYTFNHARHLPLAYDIGAYLAKQPQS